MSHKKTFNLSDLDLLRVSSFLSNASKIFKTNPFIKNFEYLNLFFYIYLNNAVLKKRIRFKDLNIYSAKSSVYLSKFIKEGIDSGYLTYKRSEKDKRIKTYFATKKSKNFFKEIYSFEELK